MIGVSTRTVFRRMAECNLSIRARYSTLTDEELDDCVKDVKQHMPQCGYRMMRAAVKDTKCSSTGSGQIQWESCPEGHSWAAWYEGPIQCQVLGQ